MDRNPKGFVHGLKVYYQGDWYYFKGAPAGDGWDVPGHTWVQTGPSQVEGRHYNIVPWYGMTWTDDTRLTHLPEGILIFKVRGIIATDPLDPKLENKLIKQGYVHRHELVDVDGIEVPGIWVYLKHIAVSSFYFDNGPFTPHYVTPGIDDMFMPNW